MRPSTESHTRRRFLSALASVGTAAVAAACSSRQPAAAPAAVPASAPSAASGKWDESWPNRLTDPHRAVIDAATIDNGLAIAQTGYYLESVKEIHGTDPQAVLVLRHTAVPIIFAARIWETYGIGAMEKIAGRQEGAFVTTNIYAGRIAALQERGVTIIGCDLALRGYAHRIARHAKAQASDVETELRANLLPAVILQPTGVYAVHRAQRAGCTYVRSS